MSVFKKSISINVGMLFLFFHQGVFSQASVKSQPNVIVIMTDDQGSIDLNSYGATDLFTPNMDRLAK